MTSTGLFISLEGVDGVGKSTQAERLRAFFEARGRTVVMTREPGGTALGVQIRRMLLHGDDVSPRAEALLYAADRAHHVATVIRPALEAGHVVISDRYIDSSLAYQAGGRELSQADIRELSEFATGGLWPQRTYVLDMSFEASRARLTGEPDRLESAGSAFFERTREAFLELARADEARCRVVDASQSVEDVWAQIHADVEQLS
ncbi:dTMP kinase [Alloscardovia macacae]|uniref:Thymidylate kinase n=1 Tax=Alloscardovia macacae TaxID=1160091 RepID=A0A1Y2T1K9_9BIFI|nr:dTMP kinase [Alloscardovia macacae]OTA26507.1 dTMP kinase [Alloscardovia macacae]OTA29814.1 dTMP kinase [Alloscardovia macacae]